MEPFTLNPKPSKSPYRTLLKAQRSSYFHSDFQPTLVLAMGVSMVVGFSKGALS